jgi:RNA polymerase sigma-70 factor (ECF subfamily)
VPADCGLTYGVRAGCEKIPSPGGQSARLRWSYLPGFGNTSSAIIRGRNENRGYFSISACAAKDYCRTSVLHEISNATRNLHVNFSNLHQDRALAKRVASGNVAAFEEFFREYFPRLFRFTMTRVNGDCELAEEIVQRTMCRVVKKMGRYRGEALLFTWLCQICRNEMATVFRERGLQDSQTVRLEDNPAVRAAIESISIDADTPEKQRNNEELARFVRLTLEYLPGNYATALELKYIRGCSVEEIGAHLAVSTKAAESILSRARAAFKEGFRSLWDFDPDFLLE